MNAYRNPTLLVMRGAYNVVILMPLWCDAFTLSTRLYSFQHQAKKHRWTGEAKTSIPRNPNEDVRYANINFFVPAVRSDEKDMEQLVYPNDYLITDSTFLPSSSRPSLLQALSDPRDILATITVAIGVAISFFNVKGNYDLEYEHLEIVAISLGFLSSFAYIVQIVTGYRISPNIRRGVVDEATVNLYAAAYTACVSWLALRTCDLCPSWLYSLDGVLPLLSVIVFLLSVVAPYFTLFSEQALGQYLNHALVSFARSLEVSGEMEDEKGTGKLLTLHPLPELSPTELLRARGLLAVGILACVFAPDALSFALGGQDWWDRVYQLHPSQRYLESSTALFALFSVEASMIAHRVGKTGAASYSVIVPCFAAVCLMLAIIPCVCALHWLGNDISFFSFYRE